MNITARQPLETTIVAVSPEKRLPLPEPADVFALFPGATSGATYFDDVALGVRAFTIPDAKLRLTFERIRVRIDDIGSRHVEDLTIAELLTQIAAKLYPPRSFTRYGFNYDVVFRYDQVIPSDRIMGAFFAKDMIESITHFGWQATINREKGKRRDTYFFKAVSPLELQVLANVEFDRHLPEAAELQKQFQRLAIETQDVLNHLSFT